jgi:hypothetical protein
VPHSSRYTRRIRLFIALNARFAQRRARALLSVTGVALGVALGFGVHLVNRAAVEDLAAGVRTLAGDADLEVRGGRTGFPEALYPKLARLPGVAAASPALELDAGLPGGGAIRVLGIDPLRAAQLQPALFAHQPQLRAQILKPDTVLLSQAAAERLRLGTGGHLQLVVGLERVALEVIGTLPASGLHGVAALADIATVQWRLDRTGELNRIGLRLAPGADREALRARVAALLPAGVHVTRVETVEASGAALSRAYRVNLNVLALVALVTGGFLVFSAQAMDLAARLVPLVSGRPWLAIANGDASICHDVGVHVACRPSERSRFSPQVRPSRPMIAPATVSGAVVRRVTASPRSPISPRCSGAWIARVSSTASACGSRPARIARRCARASRRCCRPGCP